MSENFDKQKMIGILVDPGVSIILSELEDGSKDSVHLTEKLQISDSVINERLSYVIQHGFVKITQEKNKTVFTVDKGKLDKIMEIDENFSGVVDGLTELDQYLN
jgi:DNA-binding HxlR family transcriptional regulator